MFFWVEKSMHLPAVSFLGSLRFRALDPKPVTLPLEIRVPGMVAIQVPRFGKEFC